jgi:hypothetical protein
MIIRDRTRRPLGPTARHEETVAAARIADWDAVHDAARESLPASDAPSWSGLRAGPPGGGRDARPERQD